MWDFLTLEGLTVQEKQAEENIYRMFFMLRNMIRSMEKTCRQYDLGFSQYMLLRYVERNAELHPSEAACMMRLSRPAITKILRVLEEQGFLLRLESPNSRREICMELTQKGKDKLKEVTPAVSKLHRGLLTTMGDMELEGFEKVLRKMEVFFEDYIGEEKHDHNT